MTGARFAVTVVSAGGKVVAAASDDVANEHAALIRGLRDHIEWWLRRRGTVPTMLTMLTPRRRYVVELVFHRRIEGHEIAVYRVDVIEGR